MPLGELRRNAEVSEYEACARALVVWYVRERERMWKTLLLWFWLDVTFCTRIVEVVLDNHCPTGVYLITVLL